MSDAGTARPVRILAAIVTYNEPLSQTAAFRSLCALPERWQALLEVCSVANRGSERCDSAPKQTRSESRVGGLPVLEIDTHCNGGLALGYNLAIERLRHSDCDYILFLNSDSNVTAEFLDAFDARLATSATPPPALAPILMAAGHTVSPFDKPGFPHPFWIIGFLFCHRSLFPDGFTFPAAYWLDGIDYWFSHELWRRSIAVSRLDLSIEHQLSVLQGFRSISGWRYRNILACELRFLREHGGSSLHGLRVMMRAAARCLLHRRTDLLPEIMRAAAGPRRA